MDTAWAQASEIADAVADGSISAVEVTEAALARIAERDRDAQCVHRRARKPARSPGLRISTTRTPKAVQLGPLAGVPFAVKNLFDIAGLPTLAGSKINRDRAAGRAATPP